MTHITDNQRREVAARLRKGDEETGVPLVIDGVARTSALVARCKRLAGVE